MKECVRIAFEELGLHRIEANIMPHNIASLGVVRRCGFVEEGFSEKINSCIFVKPPVGPSAPNRKEARP